MRTTARSLERPSLKAAAWVAVAVVIALFATFVVVRTEPRAESAMRLSDGAVWLPSLPLGGVSLLDGGSGTVATSLTVAQPGQDFSVEHWGSDAIVVNRADGSVVPWRLDEVNKQRQADGQEPIAV